MLSTDKRSYLLGQNGKITINDPEANLNNQSEETVLVILTSDSDQKGLFLELERNRSKFGGLRRLILVPLVIPLRETKFMPLRVNM